jgi:RNA polymerase sigma factor for flagellar operon FliA
VAKKLATTLRNVQIWDLVGSGAMGLFQAIQKYNPARNVRFEHYAAMRVRGAMLDGLREEDAIPRCYRERAKRIYKVTEDLAQKGVRSPSDVEIRKALRMNREAFENTKLVLRALPVPGDTSKVEFQEDARQSTVEVAVQFKEIMHLARARLTRSQFRVLSMYYGEDLTFKEIGKSMGLSESRVCQVHAKALFRLRVKLMGQEWA